MKRFLITTALEDSWRYDQPVLFLGEWCRRYARRQRWSRFDAMVLPYHWDDRAKLHADYIYLQSVYERMLAELSTRLNAIHRVAHSRRYWRILVGPWLGYFIQILFDRWTTIRQAVTTCEISGTIFLTRDEGALVPQDMAGFVDYFLEDEWNHHVYAILLKEETGIDGLERPAPPLVRRAGGGRHAGRAAWLLRRLASGYMRMAAMFGRDTDAFLLTTYLPPKDEVLLHGRLGQFPQRWRSVPAVRGTYDALWRSWETDQSTGPAFETLVRRMLPRQIPVLYLEGYQELVRQAEELPWPRNPKVIWTSNSEIADDVFKAWAAAKVERGCPLVIGQHGGHYGMGRWSFTEEHQKRVCDRYLSWGWTEPGNAKVVPVGQLKAKRPLGVKHAQQKRALLVTAVHPRYSYWMYSTPVAGQWLGYFTDQYRFVAALPPEIRKALTVRLYPQDCGWDQVARWRDQFPDLTIDDGRKDMKTLVAASRVYISTYNATTFLESLTMNVPTMIYWNPAHWELNRATEPYFKELTRVGIFHDSPQAAAGHLARIWADVDAWWSDPEVRKVRDDFQERYCRSPRDLLGEVVRALQDVAGARPAGAKQDEGVRDASLL